MNEINLEKTKRKLKARGVIISEQGLFIDMPRIFSVPPDEYGYVLKVKPRLPATFPIVSFDTRREIERNFKKTFTEYYIYLHALSKLHRVGPEFQQKTVLEQEVGGGLGYHTGSNEEDWEVFSFSVEEAVILEESRRLTTCERIWSVLVDRVPVMINYVITTIKDSEIPIYRTNVIKKFKTYDCVRIDVHRHKIHQQKWYESASYLAKAIAKSQTLKGKRKTYQGLQLSSVRIHFPLDETNLFHFIFKEKEGE